MRVSEFSTFLLLAAIVAINYEERTIYQTSYIVLIRQLALHWLKYHRVKYFDRLSETPIAVNKLDNKFSVPF